MRVAGSLVLIIFVMLFVGLIQKASGAELELECLSSPAEVVQLHTGARPVYSTELEGKEGAKCWFPKKSWMGITKVARAKTKRHHVHFVSLSPKPQPKAKNETLKKQFFQFLDERFRDDFNWYTVTKPLPKKERIEGEQ